MKWFNNPTSMEDVKKQYKALIRVYHPDNGGDLDKMQEINAEYNELCDRFEKGQTNSYQYGYHSNSGYGSYQNGTSTDEFSNMVRPVIEQEINKTVSIVITALRLYPAIQAKYDRLITHESIDIYKDLTTVLKVTYDELQQNMYTGQANYQFINLMSELENVRRITKQTYETACNRYGHNLEQELNDLYGAVGNTIKEQILAAKQSGSAYYGYGNGGYYNQNSSYPHGNDGCNDCCQCLGLMMCCDCIDCC